MAKALYDGVGGIARKVIKKYDGVGGIARKVVKAYSGVAGVARQYWASETPLGNLAVGDSVYMKVNGVRKEFIIVHRGLPSSDYASSCDGTWLLMKDIYESRVFDTRDNDYGNSDLHSYLNSTFLGLFETDIQTTIKRVKLPYTKGAGDTGSLATGANGLSAKVFLLSFDEIGGVDQYDRPTQDFNEGAVLDYFDGTAISDKIAYYNGTATEWWTRSPQKNTATDRYVLSIDASGYRIGWGCESPYGVRPCVIIPSNATVDGDFNVIPPPLTLGALSAGDSVYMNVNGISKEFLVVQQGLPSSAYDTSCDGTWLLMKDVYENKKWDSGDNDYGNSDLHSYLNNTFVNLFDIDIKSAIKQVKVPYTNGLGSTGTVKTGANGITAKAFLLSYTEVGHSGFSNANVEGAVLNYFNGAANSERVAILNGSTANWWLRSPYTSGTTLALYVSTSGSASRYNVTLSYGVRPCVILPSTLGVDGSFNVVT